jgi:hypothetical protein
MSRLILLSCALLFANCAHEPEFQDMRIQLPTFNSTLKTDAALDGYVLQAIRIAADDLLPPEEPELSCIYRKISYRYQAIRQGDLIFVRVDFNPRSCGGSIGMLDGGATYAISLEGRILRRAIDGTEPFHESSQAPDPEKGAPAADTPTAPLR